MPTGIADANGVVVLSILSGERTLLVSAPGYGSISQGVVADPVTGVQTSVDLPPPPYQVTITVVDANGNPIAGAAVTVKNSAGTTVASGTTNVSGLLLVSL